MSNRRANPSLVLDVIRVTGKLQEDNFLDLVQCNRFERCDHGDESGLHFRCLHLGQFRQPRADVVGQVFREDGVVDTPYYQDVPGNRNTTHRCCLASWLHAFDCPSFEATEVLLAGWFLDQEYAPTARRAIFCRSSRVSAVCRRAEHMDPPQDQSSGFVFI